MQKKEQFYWANHYILHISILLCIFTFSLKPIYKRHEKKWSKEKN